jgi:hypothetical protein
MPTRKQRRRKQKSQRHEYEYVYVDDEGHEVDAPEAPVKPAKAKPAAKGGSRSRSSQRPVRAPREPNLRRAAAMGVGFALILVLIETKFGKSTKSLAAILPVAIIWSVVLTFTMYWIEKRVYRSYLRRSGQLPEKKEQPAGVRKGLFRRR